MNTKWIIAGFLLMTMSGVGNHSMAASVTYRGKTYQLDDYGNQGSYGSGAAVPEDYFYTVKPESRNSADIDHMQEILAAHQSWFDKFGRLMSNFANQIDKVFSNR